jgi:phosphomannomutase
MDELDGVTIEYGDLSAPQWWWCNVRPSNTEPLLRLNLEATSPELRDQMQGEVVSLLGAPLP